MPQVHGKALGVADGRYGGRTPRRQGQPVGRNRAPGPEKWTAKEWRKVYGFAREGEGMVSEHEKLVFS